MLELQQDKILYIEKSAEDVNYDLEQGDKHVAVAVSSSKLTRKVRLIVYRTLLQSLLTNSIEKVVQLCHSGGFIDCCSYSNMVVCISEIAFLLPHYPHQWSNHRFITHCNK